MITSVLASVLEAWQELRVHRVRVLMSLIGVGVAVCALTLVVGFGDMMQDGLSSEYERQGGRAATYTANIYDPAGGASSPRNDRVRQAVEATSDRFGITYHSAVGNWEITVDTPSGALHTAVNVVEPLYGQMRRIAPDHGRWFTDADRQNMSPPIIADEIFLERFGIDPAALPTTVDLPGGATATIIGSMPSSSQVDWGTIYALPEQSSAFRPDEGPPTDYEFWLPPDIGQALAAQVQSDLKRQLPGFDISVGRTDFASDLGEGLAPVRNVLLVISSLILGMGVLGLLNISLVTIGQRIREIGIRRSFGATSRRIFFSVMMESVVATTVAGAIGVLVAVLVLKAPIVMDLVFEGASTTPQVPVSTVVVGMLVSVGVGALAGLIPAIVATRVSIVGAIRA